MILVKKQHKLALFSLLISLLLSLAESAEISNRSSGDIKSQVIESRTRFSLSTEAILLNNAGTPANSIGFGVGIQYALSEKWALKTSFNQAFYITAFSPLYSSVDIRAVYALTGSLISKNENITVGSNEVLKSEEYLQGGWRLQGQSDLYFFNTDSSVISFTGLGIGASYEFPSTNRKNINIGMRLDFVSSSTATLVPLQLFVEILF